MADHKQKALNALAKGAGITAIGMAVSKALTYLYRVFIARFVGPEAYGQLSLALMVTGIASTIAYLSIGNGLKKFIPEYRTKDENLARIKGIVLGTLQITLPLSVVLWAITFFGAEFIAAAIFGNNALVPLIKIMSFTVITGTLSQIFYDTTIGFNKIIYKVGSVRILQNIIQLFVTAVLLLLGYQVASAAWGWLVGSFAAMLLGIYFIERKIGPIITSNVEAKYERKKLVRFSAPLLLSGVIGTLMGWADTGLLGYYMTDFEVGIYNAALPTALLILLPHKAIGSLAVSSFSELKEREEESIESSLQTATYWVFALVFPTFLILLLFSEQVLHILFGSVYRQGSIALSILGVGYLFDAFVGRVGSFLKSKGYTRYILYNSAAALLLNLILNIILIPIYGIAGAATATMASTILTNILMSVEVWKKEDIISIPFRKIGKIAITGLIPLVLMIGLDNLLFTSTPFWFVFPAGVIYYSLYAVLFLRLLGLGDEEKQVFLRIGEIIDQEKIIESLIERLEGK
jgi:O-antigen/teichoic acid export membrane protein